MHTTTVKRTPLITGTSLGVPAVYAERLALGVRHSLKIVIVAKPVIEVWIA